MESSIIGFSRGDASAKTFKAVNPANNASIDVNYAMASEEEVEEACRLAGEAALEMAQFGRTKKAEFLNALADGIDGIVEELVPVMKAETGLPVNLAWVEVGDQAGHDRSLHPPNFPLPPTWQTFLIDPRSCRFPVEIQPPPGRPDARWSSRLIMLTLVRPYWWEMWWLPL